MSIIENDIELCVLPLTQEEFDEMWDEVKDDTKIICAEMAHKEIFRAGTIWYYHHLLNKK